MDAVFNDIMTEIKKSPILAYAMKIQGDQALQVAPVQTQPQLNVVESPQTTQSVTDTSTPTQTVSPY